MPALTTMASASQVVVASLSPPWYRGVLPQSDGRWDAVIDVGHSWVWIGSFIDEEAAARTYDLAARFFLGLGAFTNIQGASIPPGEIAFLDVRSNTEIVNLLQQHTYTGELMQCHLLGGMVVRVPRTLVWARELLFEKAMTLSDVGKFNRLVVPKQQAERHFPHIKNMPGKGMVLSFEDGDGKVWPFRYMYWSRSQLYVLTKYWTSFFRDKDLQAGDIVVFSQSVFGHDRRLFIDCKKKKKKANDEAEGKASKDHFIRLFGVNIVVDGCKKEG